MPQLPHLNDFISYLASEKGLSQHSIDAYRRDVSAFCKHFSRFNLVNIQQAHFIEWLSLLQREKYADSSISRAISALKVFFKFLKRERIITSNPAEILPTGKIWHKIPEVLTYPEMVKLLAQPDPETVSGARDKAIFELMYACGLRVSELCNLKIQDVDDTFVRIKGKGRKERLVPLGKIALEVLDTYLSRYRDGDREERLFVNERGKQIDRIMVWKQIKKYAAQAGITKKISPHTLRHAFATHLLDHGADLRVIQEMLGHASINSTDRYTQISKSHLQKSFDTFHPRK